MNWATLLEHGLELGVAWLLAIPVAWDREKAARSAGLRTFPLVSIAACAFILVGASFASPEDAGAKARLIQAVVTGLGFIGGGAILKKEGSVEGMATASSIWVTGAIGLACGFREYEIALCLSLVCFATLRFGRSAKRAIASNES